MTIMKPRFFSLFVSLLVFTGVLAGGCTNTPSLLKGLSTGDRIDAEAGAPVWPHHDSDLPPDPDLTFGRLDNGFRYVLMQNKEPKDRTSMHLNIQVGSMHETDTEQGMAHFLEHMLFNGSENFAPGELVKYFQRIGMQFGPDANAHTSFDETVYDVVLPDSGTKSIEEGLQVLRDYADGALLLQSEIDRERSVVMAEMRSRDSASYRNFVASMKFQFPELRISRRLPIGSAETLTKINQPEMRHFYDTWYRPDKMVLVMVGDFDTEATIPIIRNIMSGMKADTPPPVDVEVGTLRHKGIKPFHHYEREIGQTTVTLQTLTLAPKRPDSLFSQQKMLLADMANAIVQNRLDAMLKRDDTPFTSARIGSGLFLQQVEISRLTAECSPDKYRSSLLVLEQTLRQALTYGFHSAELARVQKEYLSMLDNAEKEAATRNSSTISRAIIRNINSHTVMQSPQQEREIYSPIIRSVTIPQLVRAFKDVWKDDHRLVMVTGNAPLDPDEDRSRELIADAYNESLQTAVQQYEEAAPVNFPYLPVPDTLGPIAGRQHIKDLDILQVDFKNGVRLNAKKTTFKDNQVLVRVVFGNGKSTEPLEKPGLADLSMSVFNESGLGRLSMDELDVAMAGKESQVALAIRENHFLLNGTTVTGEIELMFQLLYAYFRDPGLRPEAYRLSMDRFEQEYREMTRSVEGALKLDVFQFLAGGDSRFGYPSWERFKALTLDDIRQWLMPAIQNQPVEISVCGDVDLDLLVDVVARYFGTMDVRVSDNASTSRPDPAFAAGRHEAINVATRIPKSLVVVAYPTADFWDIRRTRRLNVLASVLDERLRVQIRERLGAAYSPFAFNRSSRAYQGYGALHAMIFGDPAQAEMLVGEVREIAKTLAAGSLGQEELDRALKPTRTEIRDMRRTNEYWVNSVLAESRRNPRQLDWSRSIVQDYEAISLEEISALARQYFVDAKAATIIVTPGE
ncbi:MAG: insulinase family protein [Desulfobacteraceae bacterium]|nr:insulinase family protein [Desulfobacteraceae bacterium]